MQNSSTAPAIEYVDSTPDDIFIKVYPARLRRLIRETKLRRAEIGELLLLALRIDGENRCWPSKEDSAACIGMKSPDWARRLQHSLKSKGAIDWDFDHDKRSPRFTLPDAFYFGKDSYPRHNTESRGDRNTESRRGRNSTINFHNKTPEQESTEGESVLTKTKMNRQTESQIEVADSTLTQPTKEQESLIRALAQAEVSTTEAYLIGMQYRKQTVESVIEDCRGHSNIAKPGAWIRRTIELIAHEGIKYPPNMSRRQLDAAAAVIVTAAKLHDPTAQPDYDPYFDSPTASAYFARHEQADDTDLSNEDTANRQSRQRETAQVAVK